MIEIIYMGKKMKISHFTWYRIRWLFHKHKISKKMYHFMLWRNVQRLTFSCWLWKIRGLPICDEHGFHAQSWITGNCKECKQ